MIIRVVRIMVNSCCVAGCTNRQNKEKDISLHRIPKYPSWRRKAWINSVKGLDEENSTSNQKAWEPTDHARICSEHFLEGKPSEVPTHPDFVPTQNLCGKRPLKSKSLDKKRSKKKRPTPFPSEPSVCPDSDEPSVCPDYEEPNVYQDYDEPSVCLDSEEPSVCPDSKEPSVCPDSDETSACSGSDDRVVASAILDLSTHHVSTTTTIASQTEPLWETEEIKRLEKEVQSKDALIAHLMECLDSSKNAKLAPTIHVLTYDNLTGQQNINAIPVAIYASGTCFENAQNGISNP